jgi:hypothetical protein
MATIEARRNAAGRVTSYRVEWYDGGQRKRQTLPTEQAANQWKGLLEAVKHDTMAAQTALLRQAVESLVSYLGPDYQPEAFHVDSIRAGLRADRVGSWRGSSRRIPS